MYAAQKQAHISIASEFNHIWSSLAKPFQASPVYAHTEKKEHFTINLFFFINFASLFCYFVSFSTHTFFSLSPKYYWNCWIWFLKSISDQASVKYICLLICCFFFAFDSPKFCHLVIIGIQFASCFSTVAAFYLLSCIVYIEVHQKPNFPQSKLNHLKFVVNDFRLFKFIRFRLNVKIEKLT